MKLRIGNPALDPPPRELTRRQFLVGMAVTATGTLFVADALVQPSLLLRVAPTKQFLVRSLFTPHLGDLFAATLAAGGALHLRLTAVRDTAFPLSDPEQSFEVEFQGDPRRQLPQDSYRLNHPRMGAFELFIVPGSVDGAAHYTAIFNRLPATHRGGPR